MTIKQAHTDKNRQLRYPIVQTVTVYMVYLRQACKFYNVYSLCLFNAHASHFFSADVREFR